MSRLFVVALTAVALLGGSAPAASPQRKAAGRYDLRASYPNAGRLHGFFQRGVNAYGSATSGPARTSLWFELLGDGAFKQFNTTPYRECHWDLLRWSAGTRGVLVYLETHADCYSDHTAVVFHPGIVFMPQTWTAGARWSDSGVSSTVFSENGVVVCNGTNTWRSRVVGLATMPNRRVAVHTQTNEVQVFTPAPGAPSSTSCPAGQTTSFGWQENFYVGGDRLARSTGGNTATAHPQWDSVFSHWNAMPPADAGTVTASTTEVANASTGNTIAFTYIAPRAGLSNALVTIAVPPGWTPPVTSGAAGCTTASAGTVTTEGQTIMVAGLTLPPAGRATIVYGAVSGGACTAGDGATAAATPGAPVWQVQVTLQPGAQFTNLLSSPSIDVG